VFVENKNNFGTAVTELEEFLKIVNNLKDTAALNEIISQVSHGAKLPHISIFCLQLFLPLAALCGLVLSDKLFLADVIQPSLEITNGSHTALSNAGFELHQYSYVMKNVCTFLKLPARESIGEALICESQRHHKHLDLFIYGQALMHLFMDGSDYEAMRKKFNSMEWEAIVQVTEDELRTFQCL
jgi:hypothetical protein